MFNLVEISNGEICWLMALALAIGALYGNVFTDLYNARKARKEAESSVPSGMPLFTTSAPGFMGSLDDIYHMELEGEKQVDMERGSYAMYFHGEVEDWMGYDIPFLLSGHIIGQQGRGQKCQVITPDGEYLTAYINKMPGGSFDSEKDMFYIEKEWYVS